MKLKSFVAILFVLLLGACRVAPTVYNVNQAPIATAKAPSQDDVRKAIVRAGTSMGWQMKENGPNALIGTLNLRTHSATVDIPFNAKQYSILYKDSSNLNYDGTSIHKNYNGWIQNLQKQIDVQLSTL